MGHRWQQKKVCLEKQAIDKQIVGYIAARHGAQMLAELSRPGKHIVPDCTMQAASIEPGQLGCLDLVASSALPLHEWLNLTANHSPNDEPIDASCIAPSVVGSQIEPVRASQGTPGKAPKAVRIESTSVPEHPRAP